MVTRFEWRATELGKAVAVSGESRVRLRGDRIRLEQALGNLVDNALRYGGPSVDLEASIRDGLVELHVRDDGPGFPAGFLAQAFERFSRPDAARSGGGAGLGLSIVRTIAEAHGGSVHARNGARPVQTSGCRYRLPRASPARSTTGSAPRTSRGRRSRRSLR
jgi:signal transduction histidine kinase